MKISFQYFRDLRDLFRDPEVRGLLPSVAGTLLMGTVFYRIVEGWGWGNSLYFSVITLTTVGYGDYSPQTGLGRLFTIFYLVIGIGLLLAFVNVIAKRKLEILDKRQVGD
ncbi:MAG: two pore domain potassium channel family protein [Candidatus Methanofastidiosa archaeon]|nr:two pore domain potassium channel family protein [Candidatus Methanofastidiosa archaeon]